MPYHIHIDERGIERLLRTFLKTNTIVEKNRESIILLRFFDTLIIFLEFLKSYYF